MQFVDEQGLIELDSYVTALWQLLKLWNAPVGESRRFDVDEAVDLFNLAFMSVGDISCDAVFYAAHQAICKAARKLDVWAAAPELLYILNVSSANRWNLSEMSNEELVKRMISSAYSVVRFGPMTKRSV